MNVCIFHFTLILTFSYPLKNKGEAFRTLLSFLGGIVVIFHNVHLSEYLIHCRKKQERNEIYYF